MPEKEATPETCIIVVDVGGTSSGLLVDTVKEVMDIGEEQKEDPPSFGTCAEVVFVRGFGKIGNQARILLDIDRVLGDITEAGAPV